VATFIVMMIVIITIFADQGFASFGFPFQVFGVSIDKRLFGIIIATIVLCAVMAYDDLKGAPAYLKLFFQILSALVLIFTGIGLIYLNNPFGNTIYLNTIKYAFQISSQTYHFVLFADLFFIFWVLTLTNATNFIDGLDGLSATLNLISVAIIGALSYSIGQNSTALMCAVLVGAIVGFLPFNLPFSKRGAKMFLGDTGAMFLGLMLAVLTVITGGKLVTVSLVFGLAIIDALYVVFRRIAAGKNPFTSPDQSHIHHRFLRAGLSKGATLIIISSFSLLFGLAGLMVQGRLKMYLLAILVVLVLAMFVILDRKKAKLI